MDELLKAINKYPNGTKLIINLKSGVEVKGEIDTIYETNNGLDMDEEGYQEYYACAFKILDLKNYLKENLDIKVGELIEISMQEPPFTVMLENGTVVWERPQKNLYEK